MSYLFLQVIHYGRLSNSLADEEFAMVRDFWESVALALKPFFPNGELPATEAEIGALVMLAIADGPFVESIGGPSATRLVRIILTALMLQSPS